MTGALAWTGRLVFLVLAMLAALSIIGSIAAIPSSVAGQRLGIEHPRVARPDAPVADLTRPAPQPAPVPQPDDLARPGEQGESQPVVVAAEPTRDDPLLWLEPLTYAVLALAGLLAIAVLLLWRAALALETRA